ncbi:MAG: hypothetical protein MJY66_01755, partial [Bacteroidaceae bacterium]|nr:hypothetical protein [Bacteroidaceae bacterium]
RPHLSQLLKWVSHCGKQEELVYVFRAVFDGPVHPSAEELDGGRFWSMEEIKDALGKNVLTPNFESEFLRFLAQQGQSLHNGDSPC